MERSKYRGKANQPRPKLLENLVPYFENSERLVSVILKNYFSTNIVLYDYIE